MGPGAGIRWVAFGGTVVPVNPKWGDMSPVVGTGREGWVHKLSRVRVARMCEIGVLLE